MALSWLLLEGGDNLLLEDGSLLLTEDSVDSRLGDLAVTLGAIGLAAAAALAIAGSAAVTIAPITLAASTSSAITGSLATTLGPVTLSASTSSSITGALALTLPAVALVASGTVSASAIVGAAVIDLATVTLSASAEIIPADEGMEPVTLTEAKAHLRVIDDSEDDLIAAYITAAREWVENFTGQILVRRQVTQGFDAFTSRLTLNAWPIASGPAVLISYLDSAGAEQTFADYRLSAAQRPARLVPAVSASWPSPLIGPGAVTVTVTAGYASRDEVPRSLRQAMLLLIGHLFANRETVNVGNIVSEVPFGTVALAQPYRLPVVG